MVDQRITDLTDVGTIASGDVFYVVDVSDTTDNAAGSSKKVTYEQLVPGLVNDNDTYTCSTSTLTVNNFVYLNASGELALADATARSTLPVYGVIREKPSATTAKVLRAGERGGFSGLGPNTVYYLTSSGTHTSTVPSTGYIVPLGKGKNSSTMIIENLNLLINND